MCQEESPAFFLSEISSESSALGEIPGCVEVCPIGPLIDLCTGLAESRSLNDGTDCAEEDEEADE